MGSLSGRGEEESVGSLSERGQEESVGSLSGREVTRVQGDHTLAGGHQKMQNYSLGGIRRRIS